jgi:hypothetical protein
LDESVLFALLAHQHKATDCNGLDDPDHPLKVAARVRIPYELASNPESEAVFGRRRFLPPAERSLVSLTVRTIASRPKNLDAAGVTADTTICAHA